MAEPLKGIVDAALASSIADEVRALDPDADVMALQTAGEQLGELELKQRIDLLADALAECLSGDRAAQLRTIVDVSRRLEGFAAWPLAAFIERHCLDRPGAALDALEVVTQAFSCEFALRPFPTQHTDRTLERVHAWTGHRSEHVRRLASEGTRPRLPWGSRVPALPADPQLGLAILEALRHDPSDDVRRSVANHLNDIAKDHPDLVVQTASRWSGKPATERSMLRHALRTLVKQGHPGALDVLGFTTEPAVEIVEFSVTPASISLGTSVELLTTIRSTAAYEQHLVVDFAIHHVGADGSTSPKVFKWTTITLPSGETATLRKKGRIATASTRRYNAGRHRVELLVAGRVAAETSFILTDSS